MLLDYVVESKTWTDDTRTNNGDLIKVMATVVHIIYTFLEEHIQATVFIEANTDSKSSLYNRIVTNYFQEFNQDFEILGKSKNKKESFTIGKKYESFYIRKKDNHEQ